MNKNLLVILLLILASITTACNKTPSHVIGEKDMVDLLVDIHKAEAYMEMSSGAYADDSSKMRLKQTIFMKHHVTPEEFDTSLVWYSHNMDVYNQVYDKVVGRLEDDKRKLEGNTASGSTSSSRKKAQGKVYKDFGDTANLWKAERQLVLTAGLSRNIVPFCIYANQEAQKGDKYTLKLKAINNRANVKVLVAVEYVDGVISFVERPSTREGWNDFVIQSDSLKKVKSVYGYIKYDVKPRNTICYVDSIMLLRTHLDVNSYGTINIQKVLDKNKKKGEGAETESAVVPEEGMTEKADDVIRDEAPRPSHRPFGNNRRPPRQEMTVNKNEVVKETVKVK